MSADDASALNWWSAWYSAGTWLVILGVLLEGAEICTRWFEKRKRLRSCVEPWSKSPTELATPNWAHNVGDIGFLILVFGLVLEQVAHVRMAEITDRETDRLTRQLESTTHKAGDAIEQAGRANERAATNEFARVALEKEVEQVRSNNIVLALKLQPRRINPEQKQIMIEFLKNAPKGPVRIRSDPFSGEAVDFGNSISNTLHEAGFNVNPSSQDFVFSVSPGVYLTSAKMRKVPEWVAAHDPLAPFEVRAVFANVPKHAEALQQSFWRIGIDANASLPLGTLTNTDPSEVIVLIGPGFDCSAS